MENNSLLSLEATLLKFNVQSCEFYPHPENGNQRCLIQICAEKKMENPVLYFFMACNSLKNTNNSINHSRNGDATTISNSSQPFLSIPLKQIRMKCLSPSLFVIFHPREVISDTKKIASTISKEDCMDMLMVAFDTEIISQKFISLLHNFDIDSSGLNSPTSTDATTRSASAHLHHMEPAVVQTYFQYYSKLANQMNMLQDNVRTSSYRRAISENLSDFEGMTVMDVGAGSGILSFFALQAGAHKV